MFWQQHYGMGNQQGLPLQFMCLLCIKSHYCLKNLTAKIYANRIDKLD